MLGVYFINMKIWNLLDWAEKETGRKFIVANFIQAAPGKGQQFWFDKNKAEMLNPKVFSNRPFPKAATPHRHSKWAPDEERFVRVDLEFEDHSRIPTEEELQEVATWARAEACGMLDTKHGCHVYFMTDKPFNWKYAKQVVEYALRNYKGEMKPCAASWATSNWSKAHNTTVRFFQKTTLNTTPTRFNTYCETINRVKCNNFSAPTVKVSGFGSEPEKHAEFSSILSRVIRGESLNSIAMLYHKPEVLAQTFNRPEYSWVKDKRITTTRTFDMLGKATHTRSIQRDFSFFGHLKHSLSDLAWSNYSEAGVLQVFSTGAEFEDIRIQTMQRFGEKWVDVVKQNLKFLRDSYAGVVGLRTVSPELLKQAFQYLRTHRKVGARALQELFIAKNKQRNILHTERGTSRSTVHRVLTLLKSCGIIDEDGRRLLTPNKKLLQLCIEQSTKQHEEEPIETQKVKANIGQTQSTVERVCSGEEGVFGSQPTVCSLPRIEEFRSAPYAGKTWKSFGRRSILSSS